MLETVTETAGSILAEIARRSEGGTLSSVDKHRNRARQQEDDPEIGVAVAVRARCPGLHPRRCAGVNPGLDGFLQHGQLRHAVHAAWDPALAEG
ncbi:hypothetical protein AB4305_27375 [Nocardia sp. 2YAB30]|uniref:hypothetical protein n=1 Tax=Nocardia sp. 2YAB30 TaxID=3233022 RepID=UPI003F9C70DE